MDRSSNWLGKRHVVVPVDRKAVQADEGRDIPVRVALDTREVSRHVYSVVKQGRRASPCGGTQRAGPLELAYPTLQRRWIG